MARRRLDDHLHFLKTSCSEIAALKVNCLAFREVRCKYVTESELTKSTKWTVSLPGRRPGGGCEGGGRRMCVCGGGVFFCSIIVRFGGVVSYCKLIRIRHFGFQNVTRHRGFERCMKRCPTIRMHFGVFA